MALHDSWIDTAELAALAGELSPPAPEKSASAQDEDELPSAWEPFVPFVSDEREPDPEPEPPKVEAEVEIEAEEECEEEEESRGASPEVLALWNRKLADIKKRAKSNGLIARPSVVAAAAPLVEKEPQQDRIVSFHPPTGSTGERLNALARWLGVTAPDCEFFACDDWGNELIPGASVTPDLAAAALTLSLSACQAGAKTGDGAPAFLGTDLGAGLLTVFPSADANGRRFLAAVSEAPLGLEMAREISRALRSVI